jgi:hypothetical protein
MGGWAERTLSNVDSSLCPAGIAAATVADVPPLTCMAPSVLLRCVNVCSCLVQNGDVSIAPSRPSNSDVDPLQLPQVTPTTAEEGSNGGVPENEW